MSGQKLHEVQVAYRIGDVDGEYPIFDATGSGIAPGRWNTAASPMIYAAEHYSTALLEKLAHGNGRLPPNQHYIKITLPNGLSYEEFDPAQLPGWDSPSTSDQIRLPKGYGETWYREQRSALLFVPSVVARVDANVLINPKHPEFARISHNRHKPVIWDTRLFSASPPPLGSPPAALAGAIPIPRTQAAMQTLSRSRREPKPWERWKRPRPK